MPSGSGPTKRTGRHVMGTEERWRELRAQGALIDTAARRARKKAPGGGARGNERGQVPGVGLGAHPLLLDHGGGSEEGPRGQGRGAHRWGVLRRESLLRRALLW